MDTNGCNVLVSKQKIGFLLLLVKESVMGEFLHEEGGAVKGYEGD